MALQATLLRDSFALVAAREPELTARFYEILFSRYPQLRRLFSPQRMAQQADMLRDAIVAVLDHLDDAAWLDSTLRALGARHVDYGVDASMYPAVGECLVSALGLVGGAQFTSQHAQAWSDAYAAIAGMMLAGARAAQAEKVAHAQRR
jgi:hemoglobin-like flavoprotein